VCRPDNLGHPECDKIGDESSSLNFGEGAKTGSDLYNDRGRSLKNFCFLLKTGVNQTKRMEQKRDYFAAKKKKLKNRGGGGGGGGTQKKR